MPSTLTWWAVIGVNSLRVESSAARWKTVSTSYSERMRSRRLVSRIDPMNSCATRRPSSGARDLTSRVMIGRSVSFASEWMRPWPISPEAPVMSTTGLRSMGTLLSTGGPMMPPSLEREN